MRRTVTSFGGHIKRVGCYIIVQHADRSACSIAKYIGQLGSRNIQIAVKLEIVLDRCFLRLLNNTPTFT